MKKLLAIISVVLFANQASAEEVSQETRQHFNKGIDYYLKDCTDDCQDNHATALKLFEKAANGGHCDAMVMMGVVYKEKFKSYLLARWSFLRAIYGCNSGLALWHFGTMFEKGLYYEKNEDMAQLMYYLAQHGAFPNKKQSIVDIYLDNIETDFKKMEAKTGVNLDIMERALINGSSKAEFEECKSSPRDCFVLADYFNKN